MSYHRSSTSILSSIDKDYIEEGRGDIYKWGETRSTNRRGVSGWAYAFKKRFIDTSILRSFLNNLTVSLLIQLILSGLFTYTCQTLDLYLDVHIALFVSPIIFPLAFSINADFQRREHVLEDLALFKGGLIVLFFCHRDWHVPSGLSQEFLKAVTNKLKGLILNVKEYLLTEKEERRSFILQVIYEDFSDISQMNEKMRVALPDSASLVQRVIHCHNLMFWAFERLRVIREYRSPRGIRSFTKVFIFVMPLLLSPYYVFVGKSSGNIWGPYYISLISTFVFGTLQGVQDVLDDPFDGISEDDINLGSLEDWTAHSLLVNRTYTVGRFTVTASVPQTKEEPKKDTVIIETRNPPSRSVSFKHRVNVPIRSILRRASHRPDMHIERPDTLSNVSEEDVGALFPEMALRLSSMKEKGLTGKTTILPGFHVKEEQPDDDSNENSTLGSPTAIQRSVSDMTELGSRRLAYRTKNVSFSRDLDDDTRDNSLERLSESSMNGTDSLPLLRYKTEISPASQSLEPDPDKFSKELIQSMKKLENSSGTKRVAQCETKNSQIDIPASLASIFQMPPASKQDSTSLGKRKSPALRRPFELEKQDERKTEEKSSRFSVSKPENNLKDSTKDTVTICTEDSRAPNSSRFAVATPQSPKSGSPSQSTATSPSPNKVKVQLPAKRFQVKPIPSGMPEDDKERIGKTNLGMSESLTSFNEDTTQTKHEMDPKQGSRFSITKPPGDSKPQEDHVPSSRFLVTKPPGDSKPQEDQKQPPSRFSVCNI